MQFSEGVTGSPERDECSGGDWSQLIFDWLDYVVFIGVLLVSVFVGVFYGFCSGGKQSTTAEFLMGNRQMNFLTLGISLTVGYASAISVLGNAAEMYNYGTQYVMSLSSFVIMVPLTVNLALPVCRELGITSIYEYLDRRFHNSVRLIVSVSYLLLMVMYISVVVYAPALALEQVTGIDTMIAVAVIFVVGILYSSMGGIKAVVWSDVFQAAVIMAALIMVIVCGSIVDGGPSAIWQAAVEGNRIEFFNFDFDPRTRHSFWSTVVGASIYWTGMAAVTQTSLQRLLSVPSQREAYWAMWLSCLGLFVLFIPTFYLGLMMYYHFKQCDPLLSKAVDSPDQMLPLYMMEVAGGIPGLPGLFVAGIFSAALSTVASGLNAVSASMLQDLLRGALGYKPSESKAALTSRLLTAGFGVISFALTFIVAQLGGVLQIALSFNGMMIGVVMGVFTLGMFVPWCNTKGVITGTLVGLAIVLWLGLGAQVATLQGRLVHPRLEVGIDCGCEVEVPENPPLDAVFDGYRISYLYYAPIGWFITVVVGTIASAFTGGWRTHLATLDPALLSPIVRGWYMKHYNIKPKINVAETFPAESVTTKM